VIAANFLAGGKRIGHLDLTGVDSAYPFALVLPQSDTERLLERSLETRGVRVERQVEATAIAADDGGATVTLRHGDGHSEQARFDWVIGCDGAHSVVRHTLGLSFEGETMQSDWILADVRLQGFPIPETELGLYWHEDGPLAVFPITPGRYRVVAVRGPAEGSEPHQPTLTEVQSIVDRRGPEGVAVTDPLWLSGFRINDRKARDYRVGRLFLAGDAAHVHSPAGGQGMNTGMQDAFNLAWKLGLVAQGVVPDGPLLDSYSTERSAVGDKVLSDAQRLTSRVVMRNPAAQAIRNFVGSFLLGLAPVQRKMAADLTEVAIAYDDSPLNGPKGGGGPEPGERVRPVVGEKPFGSGNVPRFSLCAALDTTVEALVARYPTLVEGTLRPPLAGGAIHLVRPDGYVAASAAEGDQREIAGYLNRLRRA
jgi:2-polyprenyl-6-methoxyphenol hydroxylase-like FAD-dependent oxidoreductase